MKNTNGTTVEKMAVAILTGAAYALVGWLALSTTKSNAINIDDYRKETYYEKVVKELTHSSLSSYDVDDIIRHIPRDIDYSTYLSIKNVLDSNMINYYKRTTIITILKK